MVSLDDLVALVTRGAPTLGSTYPSSSGGVPGSGGTRPSADPSAVESREEASSNTGNISAAIPAARTGPSRGSQPPTPSNSTQPSVLGFSAGAGVRGGDSVAGANASADKMSPWFREQPQGAGGELVRPLPAAVRWAFMCLLDSLFFSVKEPVEGLDRHPAVHALLESLLAVSALPYGIQVAGGGMD